MLDVPAHAPQLRASARTHTRSRLKVTLVVPLRDEESSVAALIRSVASQSRAPDAVIFVDGGSLDTTAELVRDACATRRHWSLECAGPATPGRARNMGIEVAQTEWVALTDAGIELDRHWLERLERMAMADSQVKVVWGHYEPAPDGWFTACAELAYVTPARIGGHGPVRDRSVASCLLQRQVWEEAGRFPDLRAAEDRIFIRRVEKLGIGVAVAPEAIVWWHLQQGFRRTFARFRTYSEINVRAGEQRGWHYNVARMYFVAASFILLAACHRRLWTVVPLAGASVRVGRGIWRGRRGRGLWWAANPVRFATVAAIVATVDAATFLGWSDAIRGKKVMGGPRCAASPG